MTLEAILEKKILNSKKIKSKLENFDLKKSNQDIQSLKSSTAERVILSLDEEKYDSLIKYYPLIHQLQNIVYQIYYQDNKKAHESLNSNIQTFNDFIFNQRPKKEFFSENSFWLYNKNFNILRKNSEKIPARNGRFLEKEVSVMDSPIAETPFNNADIINANFNFRKRDEDDSNFNWIYGKYTNSDDYSLRFYFNFYPIKEIIVRLLHSIQSTFDDNKIPFSFKFLTKPREYQTRRDVAVLYVPRKHALLVFEIVREIYEEFRGDFFFVNKSPLFTKVLKTGISFGENPDDRRYTSFGSYRAIHIVLTLVDLFFLKKNKIHPTISEFIKSLNANQFRGSIKETQVVSAVTNFSKGVNIKPFKDFDIFKFKTVKWTDQFYVNQFSNYNYENEVRFFARKYVRKDKGICNPYLKAAHEIGKNICREAIFYPHEKSDKLFCNWISYESKIERPSIRNTVFGYNFVALNNSLLDGRLGVALFLKILFEYTDDPTFYTFSFRAIKGAIAGYDSVDLKENCHELRWFFDQISDNKIKESFKYELQQLRECDAKSSFSVKFKREEFPSTMQDYTSLIDKVVTQDKFQLDTEEQKKVLDILELVSNERPLGIITGIDETCVNLKEGLAILGYFLLRLYSPNTVRALPFEISYPKP